MLPVCTRSERVPTSARDERALTPAAQSAPEDQTVVTRVSIDECKRCMVMYEAIGTEIAQLTKTLKDRKAQLAVVGDMSSKYLRCESKCEILTRDQRLHLKLKTTKVKVPLKKDTIRDKVLEFMEGETEKCNALLKHVYEDRPTVERVRLQRILHKGTAAVV